MFISIVTPIYNRAELINRVYLSLCAQSTFNFEWVVIDDGSADLIHEKMEYLLNSSSPFKIRFIRKENGGKHTALNMAFDNISSDWCLILDSDDWLKPLAMDEVNSVIADSNNAASGFLFLKSYSDGKVVGEEFRNKFKFTSKQLAGMKGDRAYVIKTSLLKNIRFPVYKDERFLTESYLWNKVFDENNVFAIGINKIIYQGEYLPGGLTSNYFRMLKESSKGTLDFVCSNLNLKGKSPAIYKQAAYHFMPVFSLANLKLIGSKVSLTDYFFFLLFLFVFFIKLNMRKK